MNKIQNQWESLKSQAGQFSSEHIIYKNGNKFQFLSKENVN